jgi:cobalt-zinc-cadmium efflux system outer membrane protein
VGCTGTSGSKRIVSPKLFRDSRVASKSLKSAVSAEHKFNSTSQTESTDRDSNIRLVADQVVVADEHNSTPSTDAAVPAGENQVDATNSGTATNVTLPTSGVTLAELEAMALENNPTLVQAQAAISAEQGIFHQAGIFPNPQVGYLNNTASRSGVENSNGTFFAQEFPTKNKLKLAQNSAAVEIQRYSWDNESQRKRVLNDLKIRYYEVLGAQESLKVAEHVVQIAEEIERIAADRFQRKIDTEPDYLQAERHLDLVRIGRDDAEDRLETAWDQMAIMIGCSHLQRVPINEDLTQNIPILDRETCWQNLLANSPQLRSTECDLGHAVATYNEARAQAYPNVTLQIVTKYDTVTQADTISSLVALPLPITNRNQGNIEKSSADIQAARAEITRVQLVLRDQLNESFRDYRKFYRTATRFEKTILPSMEKSLESATRVYKSGQTGITPVLTQQQQYFQTQETHIEALTNLHKTAVQIQGMQLTGGLNPAAIGSAIQNQPGGGAQRQRALLNETLDRNTKQLMPAAQIAQ